MKSLIPYIINKTDLTYHVCDDRSEKKLVLMDAFAKTPIEFRDKNRYNNLTIIADANDENIPHEYDFWNGDEKVLKLYICPSFRDFEQKFIPWDMSIAILDNNLSKYENNKKYDKLIIMESKFYGNPKFTLKSSSW